MGPSALQLLLVLLAIVVAVAWSDFSEALSLDELKEKSERRSAAYPPLALLAPAAPPDAAVWIAPDAGVNAFVASGREIFVTKGLDKLHADGRITDAQMAAIMAHELAHLECEHYRARRRRRDVETVAGIVVNRLGMIGRMVSSHALSLTRAKLSRQDEFEADARAATILKRCGLSPGDLADALALFETLEAERGGDPPSWLASHPPIAERIRRLKAL